MKNYSSLKKLNSECVECTSCNLSKTRKNVVVGKGNESAQVLIIGEGPGEQEDITGLPFVGRAGKMLDTALSSVDIDPLEDCYITNIVKCRPPNNRKPSAAESEACMPWLNEQVNLLKPKIIILAGSTAVQSFLGINEPISKIRGQWIEKDNIKYMPIFHPSYLLRNPSKNKGKPKWLTWQDLKKVKKELNSI
ncbi:MAG: uracil-DNA glycosylase [Actinobacteria bacterium]|jgi:DNA polymerase|nr:uracil-DNA glycosylase [Actinomycetota bacterium]